MILICDDEPAVRFALEEALEALGEPLVAVPRAEDALPKLAAAEVLITDLVMPGLDGFGLLTASQKEDPELPVVMLTARGSERTAVQAMKRGAFDYLAKPFAVDELRLVVSRALEVRRLRRAATQLELEREVRRPVVGRSPAWLGLLEEARRVARRDVTVLVRGETGTGKELIASMLHAASPRRSGPCVRFSCAAIPSELAESELFGHERGAFTGASERRRGYFRQAHGGTLVLDEIGELPLTMQAKLLRALQEGEVQPVGADRVEKVDVRVVAATHRDLAAEVRAGRFRADLYFRLAVVELWVPPLRERPEDIPVLLEAFVRRHAARFGMEAELSPELVRALVARPWPGNVRELENAVIRLLTSSDGPSLGPELVTRLGPAASLEKPGEASGGGTLREAMEAHEAMLLRRALETTGGNQSEAARRLGISRMTLIEKMKRHGLKRGGT